MDLQTAETQSFALRQPSFRRLGELVRGPEDFLCRFTPLLSF
jgi:hypothetical protein